VFRLPAEIAFFAAIPSGRPREDAQQTPAVPQSTARRAVNHRSRSRLQRAAIRPSRGQTSDRGQPHVAQPTSATANHPSRSPLRSHGRTSSRTAKAGRIGRCVRDLDPDTSCFGGVDDRWAAAHLTTEVLHRAKHSRDAGHNRRMNCSLRWSRSGWPRSLTLDDRVRRPLCPVLPSAPRDAGRQVSSA
jgi:hypothetical protein